MVSILGSLRLRAGCTALLVSATLAACGGGGSDGAAPAPGTPVVDKVPRLPPIELKTESVPSGPRTDLRSANYFAESSGDYWDYYLWDAQGRQSGFERVSADDPPDQDAYPPNAAAFIFSFEDFPQPFYSVGGLRTVERAGAWGQDLDGDGADEGFRFLFSQVFRGTESFAIGGTTVTAVHFSQTTTIEITPSDTDYSRGTGIVRQELWFAPGYNLIKMQEEVIDGEGRVVEPWREWRIYDARVSGSLLSEHLLDAKRTVIDLSHKSLEYDATRQRFIASFYSVDGGGGIAMVSATTGAVLQTTSMAGEPGPLLVSPSGDALYVGLDATGEVLKLDPVTLAVNARTSVGGTRILDIAVSPNDANRLALSVTDNCLGCSGGNARLVVLDSFAMAPNVSSSFFYSYPIFTFDPSGTQIYSFNNLTTKAEFAVHTVTTAGVQLARWVADEFSGGDAIWIDGSHLIVDRSTYSLPDLSLLWSVPGNVGHCAKVRPGRAVCLDFTRETSVYGLDVNRLALFDSNTGQELARPSFANIFSKIPSTTVGSPGQLAISVKDNGFDRSFQQIWLYRVDALAQ